MSRSAADRAFDDYLAGGRPEDLARVFDELAPRLLLLANHVAGEPGDAEDVVQATFLRAIERAGAFERGRPVLPWLTGILVREAKKVRRREGRSPDPRRLALDEPATPDALAELEEFRAAITRALDELPDAYTEVMTLRLVHGLAATEIAHALKIPPDTVKTRIRRGAERLKHLVPAAFAPALAIAAFSGRSLAMVRELVVQAAGAHAAAIGTASAGVGVEAVTAAGTGALARWALAGGVTIAVAAGAYVALDGDRDILGVENWREEVVVSDRDDGPVLRTAIVLPPGDREVETEPPVDPGLVAFRGALQDDRGLAITGAAVEILRLHPDLLAAPRAELPGALGDPPFVAGSAVTDGDGVFVVGGVPPWGVMLLRAVAPGAPPWVDLITVRPQPGALVELGTITVARLRAAFGRIVDHRGMSIAGAVLRPLASAWTAPEELGLAGDLLARACDARFDPSGALAVRGPYGWSVLRQPPWLAALLARLSAPPVETGADGSFVWGFAHDEPVRVLIEAPGFVDATAVLRPGVRLREPLALEPLAPIELEVTDVHGAPIPDAEVLVGVPPDSESRIATLDPLGSTGPDGRLRAAYPNMPSLLVAARAGVRDPWFVAEIAHQSTRRIRLPARFAVELRCVDRSGAPVDGPRVRLVPGERHDRRGLGTLALHQLGCVDALASDGRERRPASGVVVLDDVPSGAWIALVSAPGHAARAVELEVRGRREQTVVLNPLAETEVRVRDDTFAPLAGAALIARPLDAADSPWILPAACGETDADGRLLLARDAWGEFGLSLASPGSGWVHVVADGAAQELDVLAPARGQITGRLGSRREEIDPAQWILVARRGAERAPALPEPPAFASPRADGTFWLPALEPDVWDVCAVRRPPALTEPTRLCRVLFADLAEVPRVRVDVGPGAYATIDVDPIPEPPENDAEPDRAVHGTVRIAGAPAAGLLLALRFAGRVLERRSDEGGGFDFGELEAGSVELQVGDGLWRGTIDVSEPRELLLELDVAPFSAIVTTASGARAGGIEVELVGRVPALGVIGRSRFVATADPGGFFALDAVPAGTWSMRVLHPELGWLGRDGIEVGGTAVTAGMSIELEPLLTASGRVDAAALGLEVPAGSEILVERIADDGVEQTRTARIGHRGGFRIERLLPGRYRPTLRAALRVARPDGTLVLVPPERSGVAVRLPEFEVGSRPVERLRFDRAADQR